MDRSVFPWVTFRKCNRRFCIALLLLIVVSKTDGVNFQGSIRLRVDSGDEVNTQSGLNYPDNLTEREYLEELFITELLFNDIPLGERLRVGLRMLELQVSEYDLKYTNLENARRVDDKIYAQWSHKKWEIWAGDVTETFGRGLTLNLFENRDLYFDTSLRGGKVSYLSKNLRVKSVYGQSRTWFDIKQDNIGGVNLEIRTNQDILAGVCMVYQEGINYEKRYMPGVYSGFSLGPFSLYSEYAQRRPGEGNVMEGDGTYLSLDASILGLAAQVEYKYYNFGVDNFFQTPPVVEREITTHLLTQHPHVPLIDDQVGFDINISASPTELLFLDLDFSCSSKHNGSSLLPTLKQEDAAYWSLFLESEIYPNPDWMLKIGAGQNEEAYPTFWKKKTGCSGEATYCFNYLWSVTCSLENMWVNDRENEIEHDEQYFSVSLNRAPLGGLNFLYEHSSLDPRIEGDHWMGGELMVEIKRNHQLLLFYGKERGGLKCTSGVCRTVQSFEGFRLTYEGRL